MSILYEERLDGALPDVDRTSVLMALREHVPGLEILHTDEEIIPYECDGLSAYRTRPLLVVLPKQMEQVTAILAVCHRLRVPVVTRGAGTGLSGGALPLEKGVLLVMARFKEILDINPVGRRARVQPGVRNLAISQAVAPHNLYYAPDPSSQIACSIGGNVAENAGGVHFGGHAEHTFRSGKQRQQVKTRRIQRVRSQRQRLAIQRLHFNFQQVMYG